MMVVYCRGLTGGEDSVVVASGASSRGGDLVVKLFVEIGMEGTGTGGDGQE